MYGFPRTRVHEFLMADVLDQTEVDALLAAVDTGQVAVKDERVTIFSRGRRDASTIEVRPYDFKRPERVSKDQMRSLQTLHEAFARNFGASLSGFLRTIVEVKVATQDIDHVHISQSALLRFSAFSRDTTPEIEGTVSHVSADAVANEKSGLTYYTVRIGVTADQMARLGKVAPVPGMPVEAFIRTGERTAISYFLKPLMDQMARAFRES